MRMLPNTVGVKVTKSEREVFDLIRSSEGSKEYTCLHSLGISRHERKDYAEADFVIIGPEGVFCLEVKGGEVKRKDGVWVIGWPGSNYTSPEGPFKQAQGTRWPLISHLRGRVSFDLRKEVIFGWGVVFPSIVFEVEDPEWDQDLVYDQRDKSLPFIDYVKRIAAYFRERAKETGKSQPALLGPSRVNDIVDCLRGDFDVIPSMIGLIGDSQRELIALSRDQFRVLDFALNNNNSRIMCDGGAGTGKTLLAREAAQRLSDEGQKVLFVCFNNNLARQLKIECDAFDGRVDIWSIYQLLAHYIRLGGMRENLKHAEAEHTKEELFLEIFPTLFESAIENLVENGHLPQFDVLIVDEGQDILNAPILNCLDLLLEGGFRKGRWVYFMDSLMQTDVYGRLDQATKEYVLSLNITHTSLKENYRNPKRVIETMCRITGHDIPDCRREITSDVEFRVASNKQQSGKRLSAILLELLKGGVEPTDITVLSGLRKSDSTLATNDVKIGAPITWLEELSEGERPVGITASTISAFKGLENEVIVLTDLPSSAALSDWERSILYVGMTRARTQLFLIIDEHFTALTT